MMFNRFPIVLCLGLTALLLVSPLVDANLFRPNSRSRQYPKKENIDLSANSQASVPSAQQITPEKHVNQTRSGRGIPRARSPLNIARVV
jgi:hypothetical protein